MYETQIDFPAGHKTDVNIIANDIREKDSSFVWEIENLKDGICRLIVKSDSKDRAHKRGYWLISNVKPLQKSMGYKVKWVKE